MKRAAFVDDFEEYSTVHYKNEHLFSPLPAFVLGAGSPCNLLGYIYLMTPVLEQTNPDEL